MAKRHYIPVTADVPGAASEGNCALIRKVIRTALAAEGETRVSQICHIDRGYEDLARDLRALGADAERVEETETDS